MPTTKLALAEWKPDLGEWEHDGIYKAYNAVNVSGKWHPSPGFIPIEDVETVSQPISDLRGLWLHYPNTGTEDLYIGYCSGVNLRIASIASGTTYDAGTTLAGTPDTTSGCQMTSYGNYIYYASGHAYDIARATHNSMSAGVVVYTSPDSYQPRPKYIATIKNHLLLANMKFGSVPSGAPFSVGTAYPELVMWSATDNPLRFGDPSTTPSATLIGSDYQYLFDEGGPITGMIGGDYAFIFKSGTIWRMDGPPWQFRPVVQGVGTIYPNSITSLYNDVYFWGPGGPTRLRQGSEIPNSSGQGRYTSTLTDTLSTELEDFLLELQPTLFSSPSAAVQPIDISAFTDVRNGLVGWCVGESAVTTGTTLFRDSLVIVYDVHTDRISSFRVNGKLRFARSITKTSGKSHTQVWAGNTSMPHTLFEGVFAIGSVGSLAAGVHTPAASNTAAKILVSYGDSSDSDFAYGTFPTQWAPQFIYPFIQLEEGNVTTRITRIRVPFSLKRNEVFPGDGDPAGKIVITAKVRSKSRGVDAAHESDPGTYDSSSSYQNPEAWIDIEGVMATHHQIDIKFEAYRSVSSAERWISHLRDIPYIEVEYEIGGETGTSYTA